MLRHCTQGGCKRGREGHCTQPANLLLPSHSHVCTGALREGWCTRDRGAGRGDGGGGARLGNTHLIIWLRGAIWLWCIAMQLVQQRAHPGDDHVVGGAMQGLQLAVVAYVAGHFMGHDHTCGTCPPAAASLRLWERVATVTRRCWSLLLHLTIPCRMGR